MKVNSIFATCRQAQMGNQLIFQAQMNKKESGFETKAGIDTRMQPIFWIHLISTAVYTWCVQIGINQIFESHPVPKKLKTNYWMHREPAKYVQQIFERLWWWWWWWCTPGGTESSRQSCAGGGRLGGSCGEPVKRETPTRYNSTLP